MAYFWDLETQIFQWIRRCQFFKYTEIFNSLRIVKCGLGEDFGNVISTKKSFDLNSSEDSEKSYEAFKYYEMWLSKTTLRNVFIQLPRNLAY